MAVLVNNCPKVTAGIAGTEMVTVIDLLSKGNKLVKGVQVFTKVDNVNVRDSKAVDNSFPSNLYGVIAKKGTLLGTVTTVQTMPDGFTWIGVRLTNEAYNEIQEGKSFLTRDLIKTVPAEKYVRQDVIKL